MLTTHGIYRGLFLWRIKVKQLDFLVIQRDKQWKEDEIYWEGERKKLNKEFQEGDYLYTDQGILIVGEKWNESE